MASNLEALATNLRAMPPTYYRQPKSDASNLLAMASNLEALATNLRAMPPTY